MHLLPGSSRGILAFTRSAFRREIGFLLTTLSNAHPLAQSAQSVARVNQHVTSVRERSRDLRGQLTLRRDARRVIARHIACDGAAQCSHATILVA